MASEVTMWAYSIFGVETRKGLVKIVKSNEVITMMSPAEARAWAMNILQAAESAQTDEFLMHLLGKKIGLNDEQAVMILQEFRDWRDKQQD